MCPRPVGSQDAKQSDGTGFPYPTGPKYPDKVGPPMTARDRKFKDEHPGEDVVYYFEEPPLPKIPEDLPEMDPEACAKIPCPMWCTKLGCARGITCRFKHDVELLKTANKTVKCYACGAFVHPIAYCNRPGGQGADADPEYRIEVPSGIIETFIR